MAWLADDGSGVAWVIRPGIDSARRVDGKWVSPAPKVPAEFFADGFDRLGETGARALLNASRTALAEEPLRAK